MPEGDKRLDKKPNCVNDPGCQVRLPRALINLPDFTSIKRFGNIRHNVYQPY